MKYNAVKIGLLAAVTCIIGTNATAQERALSEPELVTFFEELLLKETSIFDTVDIELKDKQREEIAEQILYHYTKDARMKYSHVALTEENEILPYVKGYHDYNSLEAYLSQDTKIKDMQAKFEMKEVKLTGQRAIVNVNMIYTYRLDATEYSDVVKFKADAITKVNCTEHIKIDFDGVPRITNENCTGKTLFSNIDIEEPSFMKGGQVAGTGPSFGSYIAMRR
jgi:hypothetical protein